MEVMGASASPFRVLLPAALILLAPSHSSAETSLNIDTLISRMEAAWMQVNDYRTTVDIKAYTRDNAVEHEKFRYTFKKPEHIRLDFETPHPGMVLVYPDNDGKVVVQPGGLARLLKLHLSTDNRLLRNASGQRVDQTHIGILIRNIARSLTDQRRGPVEIVKDNGYVKVSVLSSDHFRPQVITFYRFFIDAAVWLPTRVEELTPEGKMERDITFQGLKINNGFPDSLFQLNGVEDRKAK